MSKIAVTGSKGRMGKRVVELLQKDKTVSLAAEVDIGDSLEDVIEGVSVVIDFTVPEAAVQNAIIAARHKKNIVIGTTGLNKEQEKVLLDASKSAAIVYSPNMSVGVNIMFKCIELASKILGKEFKVDIVETHHTHKLDKPSGTAKKILDIICKQSGRTLEKDVFFHDEATPLVRETDDPEISIRSLRRGEVVGDHAVHFTNPFEILEISHHALSRNVFAEGAIVAAKWVMHREPGFFDMEDVLGLKKYA